MKKRIAVDMDGVLADVTTQFFLYHERDFGEKKDASAIIGVEELDAFPHCRKHVYEVGFFKTLPVIANSQQILKKINEAYELFIVSAATEFPQSISEKQIWLTEHFPFISWQQIVFCGSKKIVQADIMIDDHFKNLDHFNGTTILFTQPHNALTPEGRHTRVHNWQQIAELLL